MASLTLLFGLMLAPHTVSGNFPQDLYGPVDTRLAGQSCAGGPCIWGHADSAVLPITFHPPTGYRVRVLTLRGDLIAWIKTLPGDPPTPAESSAGVLGGFQTTSSLTEGGSAECDFCTDGCPLYIQDTVTEKQPKTRAAFDYGKVGLALDADNVLNVKVAAWLNTTGKPVHIEMTYTIQFRYETVGNAINMATPHGTVFTAASSAIDVSGPGVANMVLNNRIRGRANFAPSVITDARSPQGITFLMNNAQDFSPGQATLFVDAGGGDTVLVGRQSKVEDHGAGTVVVPWAGNPERTNR